MSFRSPMLRASSVLLIVLSLCVAAFADTIRLKDGSLIKGKITGFSGGKFTVSIGSGARKRQMSFAAGDIEAIQFDSEVVAKRPAVPDRPASRTDDDPQIIKTSSPAITTPKVSRTEPATQKTAPPVRVPSTTGTTMTKPVELSVKVLADNTTNGWTNSGWVVRKGQKIRITGSGQVSLGRGISTSPSGSYDLEDNDKLLKSVPTGALIAVIGDDNNEFIYIGASREFIASRDGALFLGVNEGNLNDNSGSFEVKIEISPEGGN